MKLNELKVIKKMKIYIVVALIIILAAALFAAQQSGAFLCRLGSNVYAGQAVDNEQAIAKLAAFSGGLNRTSDRPFSSIAFNETRSKRTTFKAWLNDKQAEVTGFVLDAPYRNGNTLNYGEAYFLSDNNGNLYKLSSASC